MLLVSSVASSPARAADAAAAEKVRELNKKALEAYDNLEFEKARALLEEALALAGSSGLGGLPLTARTHLNLGMVYSAGLQRGDEAQAHFESALKIQPDIQPPAGLFNPETQAMFDGAKADLAAKPPPEPTRPRQQKGDDDDERGNAAAARALRRGSTEPGGEKGPFFVALALGTGGGFAKGTVESHENDAGVRYEWTGGFSPAPLLAVGIEGGLFIRPQLMVSLEARLQFVTGTSKNWDTPHCMPSCSPSAFAAAAFAKATWFFAGGPWKPFVSGGIGGGAVRQVVTLQGLKDCGDDKMTQCRDTVAGGPVLVAGGGGVAYELPSGVLLMGGATARLGFPDTMLNVDIMLAAGLRL